MVVASVASWRAKSLCWRVWRRPALRQPRGRRASGAAFIVRIVGGRAELWSSSRAAEVGIFLARCKRCSGPALNLEQLAGHHWWGSWD